MRCKECGFEVDSQEVFCPNCGAPLRMTADYDFIQAEIGGKVDLFLNNKDTEPIITVDKNPTEKPKAEQKTISLNKSDFPQSNSKELTIIGQKPGRKNSTEDTIAVTRAIYGRDSVFSVNGKISDDDYYGDDYDDFYDDPEDYNDDDEFYYNNENPKKPNNKRNNIKKDDDLRNIKRRAIERKKKKQKIIVISALAAIAVLIVVILIIAFSGNSKEKEKDFSDVISTNVEEGGTYSAPYEITLWSENNYRINYTLDGSEPTINSTRYGQPIKITNADISGDSMNVTLKVATYTDSSMAGGKLTVNFTINKSVLATPIISPESGDYGEPESITISGPEGATVYYTYDGSAPSKNSTLYTGPITMKRGNYILNAIAIDANGVQSEVASNVYNLVVSAQVSYEEAQEIVISELVSSGLIESDKADESQQYKVPGGGTRRVINGGTCVIGNDNYYVIQVDFTNDGSTVQATTYYGVNDQDGTLVKLNKSGMTYSLA